MEFNMYMCEACKTAHTDEEWIQATRDAGHECISDECILDNMDGDVTMICPNCNYEHASPHDDMDEVALLDDGTYAYIV